MKTIVGLFDDFSHAQKAMTALEGAGVPHNDMSLVANNEGERYASNAASTSTASTSAPAISGGAIGHDAIVGAEIGGGVGLLIGLTGLAIPGLGWIATAGWLGGMLLGAGTGAVIGGLTGALTHVGVPQEDASYYSEGVRQGGTLLAVKADDSLAARVAEILDENGAVNIDERADQYRQKGFMPTTQTSYTAQKTLETAASNNPIPRMDTGMNTASTLGAADMNRTVAAGETIALPIVEEELQVGKREVQRGGVRVYTHVTATPVEESINLHEEHVTVDRRPVDRAVSPTDLAAFKEGSMELRETAEEAVVSKQARVVEEVVIGKQATDRTETVRDTVRRTDVDVQQLDTNYSTGAAGHAARNIENDAANVKNAAVGAAERVEGNIPGVQTGGRAMDGTPDTRGITEKIADTVTGNRVDDKTGKPV